MGDRAGRRKRPILHPEFGARLIAIMEERRRRPAEFARALSVHATTMSRWRGGEIFPDPSTLRSLAQSLAVREEWLKTGQGPRDAPQSPPALAGTARRCYGAILKVLGEDMEAGRMLSANQALDHVTTLWRAVTEEVPSLATSSTAIAPPAGMGETVQVIADVTGTSDTDQKSG